MVGSAIVRRLEESGFDNLVLRTSSELDLCDQQAVDDFFVAERPDCVFLAAAKVGGIMANSTWPADFIRDNLLIQTNVIDAANRHGVSKLLFLGSSCIYPRLAPQPIKEEYLLTGPLESTNEWYAIAKIAGIKMCQAYRRQYGLSAISLMPTNLYGPNDNYDLVGSHVLPAMIRKFHLAKLAMAGDMAAIAADEKRRGRIPCDLVDMLGLVRTGDGFSSVGRPARVMLWGSGNALREFLHVDDLADAAIFLMDNYDDAEIVNVGCGEDLAIGDLAAMVCEIVGFNGEVVWDKSKPDGTPRKLLDIARLKEMGWSPAISLSRGISETYRSYLEGR